MINDLAIPIPTGMLWDSLDGTNGNSQYTHLFSIVSSATTVDGATLNFLHYCVECVISRP